MKNRSDNVFAARRLRILGAVSVAAWALLASGCGKKAPTNDTQAHAPKSAGGSEAPEESKTTDHGDERQLGTITVGGYTLEVASLGAIAEGANAAVAARVSKSPKGQDWKRANLYAWAVSAAGERLTAPSKAVVENGRLHMHVSLPPGSADASDLVFRLRAQGKDTRVKLALVAGATGGSKATTPTSATDSADAGAAEGDAGHSHEKTPHDGMLARLGGPAKALDGWLELKLHDDKGDLELWLAKDKAMSEPLDLPLGAKPTVRFIDFKGRTVTLAVRDTAKNLDEDGAANVRAGKTNYFIFPGNTGADAKWLMGKKFTSIVVVAVPTGETATESAEFVLRPHTHGPGHRH